ncbi:hypothetical protein M0R45_001570 [Rubus argutus]|uniref:Uncharacterized protein n=1 Tax=Rubus argutus TaxID=59490 RepID=A0AAW1VKN3_RUBAR
MPHSLATTQELTAPPMRTPLYHRPDLLLVLQVVLNFNAIIVIGDGDEDLMLLRGSRREGAGAGVVHGGFELNGYGRCGCDGLLLAGELDIKVVMARLLWPWL